MDGRVLIHLVCRPGYYITSDEGKSMQKDMWNELIEVLREKNPSVNEVLASLA